MTWDLFKRMFHVNMPIELLVTVLTAACIASVIVWKNCLSNRRDWFFGIWTVACLFLMLYITVLGRLGVHNDEAYRYNFMPFWSIAHYREGYVETLYEKVNNVILFVPFGVLLAGFRRFHCFRKSCEVLLVGMGASICIELLQLITRTGMCETDDVICNTFGTMIGFVGLNVLLIGIRG